MTSPTSYSPELAALSELADVMFGSITEPLLFLQELALPLEPEAWRQLRDSGLTLLTTPESDGGSGAGPAESAIVLDRAGYHALPAPLAETDLLAGWLLGQVGAEVSDSPMTASPTAETRATLESGTVCLRAVPWAAATEHIVVAGTDFVAHFPTEQAQLVRIKDIAGQAFADVTVPRAGLEVVPTRTDLRSEFQVRGAWARTHQICGATERALDLAIEHVTTRHQFGRPIAQFQAVQELISRSAGLVTMAKASSSHATRLATEHGFSSPEVWVATAAAKVHAGRAAVGVSRDVHQAHGAIGFTLDHQLRHFTTRALAWNLEFGTPTGWAKELGRHVLTSGDSTWEFVTRY